MEKLNKDELSRIQDLQTEFTKNKAAIGDLELQKQILFDRITSIRTQFESVEKELMKKYGEDSVINVQTGEVTQKE